MEHRSDPPSPDVSRRHFLAGIGMAGAGIAAASVLVGPAGTRRTLAASTGGNANFPGIPGRNTREIVLNYALTLEILEADLYRQALNAASGRPLNLPLHDDPLSYDLAISSGFNDQNEDFGFEYLLEFAYVEASHRDFLTATLNKLGAPKVSPDPRGYKFPGGPGADLRTILSNILPLEETGVRAYLGAAPYLTGDSTYLTAAGTIYSTEARHSAAIALLLGLDPGPRKQAGDDQVVANYPSENTFEYFLTPRQVLSAASVYFN